MMSEVLRVTALRKVVGRKTLLNQVDLTVNSGEIVGLIGPNGAGKTTFLKIISGTARATSGTVALAKTGGIGILPESPALISEMNALQNLQLLASIRGKVGQQGIVDALKTVGLDPLNRKAVKYYSLGMKQRLMLAQAIMEQPQLLLLDEPTNGLDPLGIIDLRQLLFKLAGQGVGIIIASHLLNEIERMCHRVVIISQGSIFNEINLRGSTQRQVEISVSSEDDWRCLVDWAESSRVQQLPFQEHPRGLLQSQLPMPRLIAELLAAGIAIESIQPVKASLEAAFLQCSRREDGVYR